MPGGALPEGLDGDRMHLAPSSGGIDFLEHCRCTKCGQAVLELTEQGSSPCSPEEIVIDAIRCAACSATFDVIWGFPFLSHYGAEDIAGLIEIAATAREDNSYAARHDIIRMEDLLQRYHAAAD